MQYEQVHMLFRPLNEVEVEQFREYARTHEPPSVEEWTILHPVCRAEWRKLGKVGAGYPITSEELNVAVQESRQC